MELAINTIMIMVVLLVLVLIVLMLVGRTGSNLNSAGGGHGELSGIHEKNTAARIFKDYGLRRPLLKDPIAAQGHRAAALFCGCE